MGRRSSSLPLLAALVPLLGWIRFETTSPPHRTRRRHSTDGVAVSEPSIYEQLHRLARMRHAGLLNAEDYEIQREALLRRL